MVLKNRRIGVIGAGIADDELYEASRRVGFFLGKEGAIVITGGLGGVMEGALRGAWEAGAITVGILPGNTPEEANPFVLIPVVTGMGQARNVIIVETAELLIAIGGGYGTLSEIALALRLGKPVFGYRTWSNIEGIRYVNNLDELFEKVCNFFS